MLIFGASPGSSAGKESACNAGDPGSVLQSGRSAGEGISYPLQYSWASLVAQLAGKTSSCSAGETWVRSLGWEDPLEKRAATHSSILAWRIPWTPQVAKNRTQQSDFHVHLRPPQFRSLETSSVSVSNCSNRVGKHCLIRTPWRPYTPLFPSDDLLNGQTDIWNAFFMRYGLRRKPPTIT